MFIRQFYVLPPVLTIFMGMIIPTTGSPRQQKAKPLVTKYNTKQLNDKKNQAKKKKRLHSHICNIP